MNPQTADLTTIPGDPEQVRRIAALYATVETRAQEIQSQLRSIESGVGPQMWRGPAADSFTRLLAETGPDLTTLAASYGTASRALATYATELAAAQDTARAAQAAATTAAAVDQTGQSLQAAQQKAEEAADRRNTAAARCIREINEARGAGTEARNLAQDPATPGGPSSATPNGTAAGGTSGPMESIRDNIEDDLEDKWPLHAGDFVTNVLVGGLVARHASVLGKHADWLREGARSADDRYRASSGGSAEAKFQDALSQKRSLEADGFERRAASVTRIVGSKIPIIGLGITAGGIGYDVLNGKPFVKASISGIGGAVAAAGVGFVIGGPVGATAGLIIGIGASAGIDWGYDQLPSGIRNSIESGAKAVESAIAVASQALGARVRNIWDVIF